MDRLTTATVTTHLGVLPLRVHVILRVGQVVNGNVSSSSQLNSPPRVLKHTCCHSSHQRSGGKE
jgi:hypothetical protein